MNTIEIIDIFYKILSLLVTIFLTCYVHRLSSENNKKDSYLQYITVLYYRIEDDSRLLFDYLNSDSLDNQKIKQHCRRISVNCTLMVYYLMRFPGYYQDRSKFERILIYISDEPTKPEYYDILSSQFEKFCWGVRKNKKSAGRFIINPEKDGYANENYY